MDWLPRREDLESELVIGEHRLPIVYTYDAEPCGEEDNHGWINGQVTLPSGTVFNVGGGSVDGYGHITAYGHGDAGDVEALAEALGVDVDAAYDALSRQCPPVWDDADYELVAQSEGEFDTREVVRVGPDLYFRHRNGGSRGAHDRMCGDGVWRDSPLEVRLIDEAEAKRLCLGFGLEPRDVARRFPG